MRPTGRRTAGARRAATSKTLTAVRLDDNALSVTTNDYACPVKDACGRGRTRPHRQTDTDLHKKYSGVAGYTGDRQTVY